MMGLINCYSEFSIQVSQSSSCSSYKPISSNLTPSIQTSAANIYKSTLSTGAHHVITVTWCRNAATQGLHINTGDDPTTGFRLNTNSRLFRKKKGNKVVEIVNNSKFEVFYDLSAAQYEVGAEPVDGYYVLVMIDSEVALVVGDMGEEALVKRVKMNTQIAKFSLVSRREYFYGNTLYATKARFSYGGIWHDVLIECRRNDEKYPCLSVCIDKRVVIRVRRLQWNFRGNQTIFVDGLSVDLMWDVHDWFFDSGSGSGSGSGLGHAVFMFRTRNGLDSSRLWLEDKVKKKEFSLLIYATKS